MLNFNQIVPGRDVFFFAFDSSVESFPLALASVAVLVSILSFKERGLVVMVVSCSP